MKAIKLTRGMEALVDDEDFEKLNEHKWYANKNYKNYYAFRGCTEGGKLHSVLMHRVVMNNPENMYIDHIDGNGLNNCKSNLRVVDNRLNQHNRKQIKTSIYTGVYRHKEYQKWVAQIRINKKMKGLGSFEYEIDAHNAYLKALNDLNKTVV